MRIPNLLRSFIDSVANAIRTLTYAHSEIHSGTHYVHRSYSDVLKDGVKEILVITPDTTKLDHTIFGFDTNGSTVLVELFEGVTASNNGTPANVRNRNRNYADNNTMLVYEDPTISGGAVAGNLLQDGKFGAGRNSFGGGARDSEELVLKQNTNYLLRITELDIEAVSVNHSVDWYEHTNRI